MEELTVLHLVTSLEVRRVTLDNLGQELKLDLIRVNQTLLDSQRIFLSHLF